MAVKPRITAQLADSARALTSREALASDNTLLLAIAGVSFVAHLLVAGNYGYFRDELYYIAAGRHPAFGYVDFPPMIAVLGGILNFLTGDNLVAIHVVSALAAAALIVVTGLMARELGGGRFAQGLAAAASAVAVVYMATGAIFSMDVLDQLWWGLAAYVVIRLLKRDEPRLWLLFGLIAGLGLFTKLTMLFFGLGLVIGLLATPARKYFRSWEIYAGGAIAIAFLLPYVLWNAVNGWPTPAFWTHYGGLTGGGPLDFVANQLLIANPLSAPLWIAGLVFYLGGTAGKPYRALGWAYVALLVLFFLLHVKPYFLAPAYAMLFAGGAVTFERSNLARVRSWTRPAYVAALVLVGLLLAPLAMPLLPPSAYASSYGSLSFLGNSGAGQKTQGVFPQYLGDRFGWDTMAASVARAYASLPADQRAQACVFVSNYGEAAGLEFYQSRYHLPPIISGHNNYYFWGPGACTGKVVLTVGLSQGDVQQLFASVAQVGFVQCQYCIALENDLPIYLATQPRLPLGQLWSRAKHFS
jgi:4-amino-4-deoxy-L-arabinose transferase-like glycosyltransferase